MTADSPREHATPHAGAILAATVLGSGLVFIDGTVVNVALPTLQRTLHITTVDAQWVIESYAVVLAAFLLAAGALGDRVGRRTIFSSGVALFGIASLGCAIAPTIGWLVAARVVQGIGGALLIPSSLAILRASFDDTHRGAAIGAWSGWTAVGNGIGPVLGGWLTEHVSWRAVFLINVPAALVTLWLAHRFVTDSKDSRAPHRFDIAGTVLSAISLMLLTYGLVEAGRSGLPHLAEAPAVMTALIAGVIVFAIFLVVERRSPHPLVPLDLFASRTLLGANLLTLLLYAALGVAFFFLPFALVQFRGYTPTEAGAAFVPVVILLAGLSRWAGGLLARMPAWIPLTCGPLIVGVGFALFAVPGQRASYIWAVLPGAIVLGLGLATTVAPLTTVAVDAAEERFAGLASGINTAVSRTAGVLAVAIFGLIAFAAGMDPGVRGATGATFLHAFRVVMLTASALSVASALIAATLLPRSHTI